MTSQNPSNFRKDSAPPKMSTTPRPEIGTKTNDEGRRVARNLMAGEREDHTLQTTALFNAAYEKMASSKRGIGSDRKLMFSQLKKAMREILVDHARAKEAAKRGGGWNRQTLDEGAVAGADQTADMAIYNEMTEAIKRDRPDLFQVLLLKHESGLNWEEIADALGVKRSTAQDRYKDAIAWLKAKFDQDQA
ncbi:MAG: ECF-type sigma factor [Phycisphaerales bacterium]|jgi:RNA polymerase sigma factor (TIGR02999 family)